MTMTVRPAAALSEAAVAAVLPMTVVKQALKIEAADEDPLIAGYRRAAIDWCERYTAKALAPRSWIATFGGFGAPLRLPREPVTAVTAVTYRDAAGIDQVLATGGWRLAGGELWPAIGAAWPTGSCGAGAVSVTFTAGFADVATEAPSLVTAMLLAMGHWYRNREAVVTGTIATEVPLGAIVLADLHRTPVIG